MRQTLRVTGELLVTVGVIVALFVAYLVWGSGMRAAGAQRQLAARLHQRWEHAAPAPDRTVTSTDTITIAPERYRVTTGQPFALIKIPAFGPHWEFPVIQGTALAQLNMSPGHVPGTQWPGQLGNFAVAGHRVTSGNPFWSLPSLSAGDLVQIQTRDNDFSYRVTGKRVVLPGDVPVLDPVPGHPGRKPSRRLITLITCTPAWTGTHRVVVTGVLVAAHPR